MNELNETIHIHPFRAKIILNDGRIFDNVYKIDFRNDVFWYDGASFEPRSLITLTSMKLKEVAGIEIYKNS